MKGRLLRKGSFPIRPAMTLKDIVARGQKGVEARILVEAVENSIWWKRLDVYCGRGSRKSERASEFRGESVLEIRAGGRPGKLRTVPSDYFLGFP